MIREFLVSVHSAFPREGLHKSVIAYMEERTDAAIHKCLIGKPEWIASLRSQ
jgi:hypothetical protein